MPTISDIVHSLAWIFVGAILTYSLLKYRQMQAFTKRMLEQKIQQRAISSIHQNKQGKASDKWASYLTYYDALFEPLKNDAIRMFEIGIQNGGSLEVWASYFRNAQKIIGCDINPKCAQLKFDDNRISVLVGDANTSAISQQVQVSAPFDVIIDDGSHRSDDIRDSFLLYFPMLKPGGLYVIEDMHTLYFNNEPHMDSNDNTLALFRELSNYVNYEFWHTQDDVQDRIKPLLKEAPVPQFLLDGWVDSVEFRNSIITLRKALSPGFNKLGARIIVGDEAIADNGPLTLRDRTSQASS
jgi:cephalosporin hydroxylase